MLKILYDHQKFSEQRFGGITRYFSSLINGIRTRSDITCRLSLLYSNNHYIKNNAPLDNGLGNWFFGNKLRRIIRWNKRYSNYLIGKNEHDILHPTFFHPYYLKVNRKPSVITVHDMIHERLPEYFANFDPITQQKAITINHANAVIAISESTKRDLIDILNVPEEKITVIHHGIDNSPLQVEPISNLPDKFLLYVGDRHTYKNFFRFTSCCAELIKKHPNLHVVYAGGGSFQTADTMFLDRLGLSTNCIQINATDAELNYLYQKAALFVFPSLYEGFGLPLLEAFKAGCPIASSNTSCFKEVGGDAVSYFDPYDEKDMFHAITNILDDPAKAVSLTVAGLHRVKRFPIENQIDKTFTLYRTLKNFQTENSTTRN